MSLDEKLTGIVGDWKGTNRLHTTWMPVKVQDSDSTASVRSKMNGQFLTIEYTWAFEGETQEGWLPGIGIVRSSFDGAVATEFAHWVELSMAAEPGPDLAEIAAQLGRAVPEFRHARSALRLDDRV